MRKMEKLRISVTEACQFRCSYCMPTDSSFAANHAYLSLSELFSLTQQLVSYLDIQKIRLTGGEPLLRPGLASFLIDLKTLNVPVSLTTNAYQLDEYLPLLKGLGFMDLNISLDSLKEENFQKISRTPGKLPLKKVLDNIEAAVGMGFKIKTNTVLMQSNVTEIPELCSWAWERGIEPRFLELMSMGEARNIFKTEFVSKKECVAVLENNFGEMSRLVDPLDSTSQNFHFSIGKKVGIIASETEPFCSHCSRLRLSAKGELFGCLMKNESVSLKELIFKPNEKHLEEFVDQAVAMKPMTRIYESPVVMNRIGG